VTNPVVGIPIENAVVAGWLISLALAFLVALALAGIAFDRE
jgi:hypothetical protein